MEFQSHIVVASQSMNKKFGAPTPSCFVCKQVNAQPYYNNFEHYLYSLFGVAPSADSLKVRISSQLEDQTGQAPVRIVPVVINDLA